jgi:hypothetical protein
MLNGLSKGYPRMFQEILLPGCLIGDDALDDALLANTCYEKMPDRR